MLRVPPEQHILKFLMTAASNKTAANDFWFDVRSALESLARILKR
jgi:hypothetical protein